MKNTWRTLSGKQFLDSIEAGKSFNIEILPHLLITILNDFEDGSLKVKDKGLRQALAEALSCLEDFVTVAKIYNKKIGQSVPERVESKEKHYPFASVDKINRIFRKFPIYIQLDFKSNFKIASKTKAFSSKEFNWFALYDQITKLRSRLLQKKSPSLQFAPYTNALTITSFDYPKTDEDIKAVLVRGLFLYFQKVIAGEKLRIMRCKGSDCGLWFISTKKNSLTCDTCCEQFWRDSKGGAKKKAEFMFAKRNPGKKRTVCYQKRK